MVKKDGAYDQLMARSKDLFVLESASGILQWDMETKMPPRGLQLRSEQLAMMDLIFHQRRVDPEMAKLLGGFDAKALKAMNEVQRRNIHLMKKAYNEESKLPERLVTETAKQRALTVGAWKKAKAAKDFSLYSKELTRMIELRQEAAEILQDVKETDTPYDALIDLFEPGMNSVKITEVFSDMREGLIKVMKKVKASDVKPNLAITTRPVPAARQRRISEAAMEFLHYDTHSPDALGRLDETEHPFSTGYFDDVRITTHYHENMFLSSLFSVLHEAGHATYDSNLPREWMYQPLGTACSFGIHESQSRFVENMIGRSPEFLGYFLPKLRRMTGDALKGVSKDEFIVTVNNVTPSKIRIEADEVTYGLHVIIRFEMERDIFAGKLKVDELPQAWNEKYKKYLGVKIENDSEGVMQDTHWASGLFGYFPSYALGNIYGGMFLEKMNKDLPSWRSEIAHGNFIPVKDWLRENVHSKANQYDPAELVKVVIGKAPDTKAFLGYLNQKYGAIYKF